MTLHDWFPEILNMSLTASIVIVAVLAARLLLRRAPKVFCYALWAVVLFRLLCPVSFETPFGMERPEVIGEDYAFAGESFTPADAVEAVYRAVDDGARGDFGTQYVPTGETDVHGNNEYVAADWFEVWVLLGGYVWLGGIAVMLIYAVVQTVRLRRRLVGAIRLRENLYLADHIDSPFVMGLFRPRIYLPSSLNEAEQEYILLHERHHIRRGDHVTRVLAFVALCLHWFNPLVWVAFVVSSKDMEMSCDEAVLRKMDGDIRADYSASLLRLATGKRAVVGSPLAFGEGDTKGRVKNVLKYRKPVLWVVVIAVVVLVALFAVLATEQASGCPEVLEANYSVDRVLYQISEDNTPAAHYSLATKDLYSRGNAGEEWSYIGDMVPYELTAEELRGYMGKDDAWLSLRRIGKIKDAYILRLEQDMFYLIMQTARGDTLLAYGWEDVSERGQMYSDDTSVWWLCRLQSDFKRNEFHTEFFTRVLASENRQAHIFSYDEMNGYAFIGYMYGGDSDEIRDMPHIACAIFRSYRGIGYVYWGSAYFPFADQSNSGIHKDTFDAFLDWDGKFMDAACDIILSTNADLAKITYTDRKGREQSVSVRGIYSMTLIPLDRDEERVYRYYDTFGNEIDIGLPEYVMVTKYVNEQVVGEVTLTSFEDLFYWHEYTEKPWMIRGATGITEYAKYQNGYAVHVEYAEGEDADCYAWEFHGSYHGSMYWSETASRLEFSGDELFARLGALFEDPS